MLRSQDNLVVMLVHKSRNITSGRDIQPGDTGVGRQRSDDLWSVKNKRNNAVRRLDRLERMREGGSRKRKGLGTALVVNSMIRDIPDNCAITQSEVAAGEATERVSTQDPGQGIDYQSGSKHPRFETARS